LIGHEQLDRGQALSPLLQMDVKSLAERSSPHLDHRQGKTNVDHYVVLKRKVDEKHGSKSSKPCTH